MLADSLDATVFAHGECGEVGVGSGPVPVTGHGLRVEGDDHAEVF